MSVSFRKHRALTAGVLLLLAAPAVCSAQALILVIALGGNKNPRLSDVVAKAAVVQLNENQLISAKAASGEGETVGSPSSGSAPSTSANVDFLLVIDDSQSGSEVSLRMSLRDAADGSTVADYSRQVPFDLNLDDEVSAAVGKLLAMPGVESALAAAAKARIAAAPGKAGAPNRRQTGKMPPEPVNAGGATGTAGVPTQGASPAAVSSAQRHGKWGFALSGGAAPLILVGDASSYFRYGGGVSLFGGARGPSNRLTVTVGLMTGGIALVPAAGISEGMVYSVLGGPELRIGSPTTLPVGVGLLASIGAAIIVAKPAGESIRAKTDFYSAGAITAHLRISRSLLLGTKLGLLVIFEERYPIIAIEPALNLGFSR